MTAAPIDELDRVVVRATQGGLPLVPAPYDQIAEEVGMAGADVRTRMQRMQDVGIIRRIGAVPNHYALGLSVNAMTVWDVRDDALAELGPVVGSLAFVSHCYERPRRPPEWPYNLFAMVHGTSRDEVELKIKAIAEMLGAACRSRDVLVSKRILKKTGLRLSA